MKGGQSGILFIRSLIYIPFLLFVFFLADLTEGVPFVQDLSG
jgi:hypothetical protein